MKPNAQVKPELVPLEELKTLDAASAPSPAASGAAAVSASAQKP